MHSDAASVLNRDGYGRGDAYLSYPLGTFKALAGRGELPRHKRGAGYRYKREELDQRLLIA